MSNSHWASSNNKTFFPRENAKKLRKLPPGVYSMHNSMQGLYFSKSEPNLGDLVRFEDENIENVLKEITTFWCKKSLFENHKFPFRRGILLSGPPGCGKSSALKLIIQEVIEMGGLAINFQEVGLFTDGMNSLREIEEDTPIVVIMEDIDSLLEYNNQSEVLNILDGINGFTNVVYLATTNYLDRLEGRIKNRPSRFDRRFFIDFPNSKSRKLYLEHIIGKSEDFKYIDIDAWVKDTAGMTPAHLKELFLSVAFFGNDYKEVIERLSKMKSVDDFDADNDSNDEYDDSTPAECQLNRVGKT